MQHIHLLGICGTGMGALAQLLKAQGHHITGSDQNIYPPMSDELQKLNIPVFAGYSANNLNPRPDLVIIGNVVRRDNPEALAVIEKGIPVLSMPQAIAQFFLAGKKSLVVAGTHGKTTTTTALAWILDQCGLQPGFLVGGVGKNLQCNARLGNGSYFAIEGDEYDTAYFDKGPKFLHYQPFAVILTSVEFDHADIYRDLAHVMSAFEKLVTLIPEDGFLIACADDANVRKVAEHARCKVLWYSCQNQHADFVSHITSTNEDFTHFTLQHGAQHESYQTQLCGEHNISNFTGILALLHQLNIDTTKCAAALKSFSGVKRRQELLGKARNIVLIDDFAHHPTAVAKTIDAIRSRYPTRKLWAVFEPRSNSTRRNHFQQDYVQALAHADAVVLGPVHRADDIPEAERFSTTQLAEALQQKTLRTKTFADYQAIPAWLAEHVPDNAVLLFMSNGSFQGVPYATLALLQKMSTENT